jgi:aldehyde dehydrogenase (NAD+)
MTNSQRFFIGGQWRRPHHHRTAAVINPATEEECGQVALGSPEDVDAAVAAARTAFHTYSRTAVATRIELLESIAAALERRIDEIAATVTMEMGAPISFATSFHARGAVETFRHYSRILRSYEFDKNEGTTLIAREPMGVCGLITPWNAPVAAVAGKVAPALAAGCTVVVKPSELAPLSPLILADVMREVGVPAGVFNMINGEGKDVGQRIAQHPDIDMISFTGSTRSGIAVAQAAAESVKRVHQELGGKSANIILPDADIAVVAAAGLHRCYVGSGQSCQAPTRMLVHRSQQATAFAAVRAAVESIRVGDPTDPQTTMGPVANRMQFEKVQRLIKTALDEGATLVTGGPGRSSARGFFVRPTVLGDVTSTATIAREEVFGPVLSILPYDDVEDAIRIANDTPYGLAGWVYSADLDRAREVARRMRTGRVYLNGAPADPAAPFGGYKRSGNGREGGVYGLESYLEIKALLGGAKA